MEQFVRLYWVYLIAGGLLLVASYFRVRAALRNYIPVTGYALRLALLSTLVWMSMFVLKLIGLWFLACILFDEGTGRYTAFVIGYIVLGSLVFDPLTQVLIRLLERYHHL